MTTGGRSTRRRRSAPGAWSCSRAACRRAPRTWRCARQQARDGIAAVLPHARAAGVPLAIEPLHPMYAADRCCISTLGQANDLCAELDPDGRGGLGVAIDVYHVFWDPELEHEIARAGAAGRILAFHVCDWLVPTRDLLLDRGMMGDGVIDIRGSGLVEAAGYAGMIEVEIFSRTGGGAIRMRCCASSPSAIGRWCEVAPHPVDYASAPPNLASCKQIDRKAPSLL